MNEIAAILWLICGAVIAYCGRDTNVGPVYIFIAYLLLSPIVITLIAVFIYFGVQAIL